MIEQPQPHPGGVWIYRRWNIAFEPMDGQWHAIGPDYDASYEGPEDGWVDNGHKVDGKTLQEACEEVDAWIDEHAD